MYLQSIAGGMARCSERGRLSKSNEENRHTENRVPSTKLGWGRRMPQKHYTLAARHQFCLVRSGRNWHAARPRKAQGQSSGVPAPDSAHVRPLSPQRCASCQWRWAPAHGSNEPRVGMFASSRTVIGSSLRSTPPALKASCYAALKLKHITQHLACSRWSGMPKPSQSASARRPLPSPSSRHSALTLACTAFIASPDSAPAQG